MRTSNEKQPAQEEKPSPRRVVPVLPLLRRFMPANGYVGINGGNDFGYIVVQTVEEARGEPKGVRMARLAASEVVVPDFQEALSAVIDEVRREQADAAFRALNPGRTP